MNAPAATEPATRIAMWSGPRNISTAMMRSWDSRADTIVCDEPLYAHYLRQTGAAHPGASEVMARHETDAGRVVASLFCDLPPGRTIFYQKHMAHHLLPGMETTWISRLTNCLLIREPRAMLISLSRVLETPNLAATGLPQQVELLDRLTAEGQPPPIIDSRDVLENPRDMLDALCDALCVPFDDSMLSWKPGPRDTDGVWAQHWYESVHASSGFSPFQESKGTLPDDLRSLCEACEDLYARLHARRLTV